MASERRKVCENNPFGQLITKGQPIDRNFNIWMLEQRKPQRQKKVNAKYLPFRVPQERCFLDGTWAIRYARSPNRETPP
ncbi:MAG TPA: hypothetical protein QGF63_04945 [Alphaproteobacteria bacterium]|jgi:hypothetical protein|nr:hypothetical protein [Alphaproteobacteria bacterium]MDP7164088.1 hypothetical protein [Alphaproteobacteria bacterium]MDP7427519.1 hypothetical protein [Alphaproteobacteria bacterium]HJM49180.1 hypothetical protein [Alphaproteobacteria bacterium]